jgi:aspartate/methionine/tyrosine aminotransferase
VKLRPPEWSFDPEELRSAFSSRTRAVIVCNLNNPSGKVFTRAELGTIADLWSSTRLHHGRDLRIHRH